MRLLPNWMKPTPKKRGRGTGKSSTEKLTERKRKFEVRLHREFEKAIKSDPELLKNLALHTYGTGLFNQEPDGEARDARDDLVNRVKEIAELKKVLDDLSGGEREESLSHMFLKTILQNFPELSSYAKQAMAGIQAQTQTQEDPRPRIARTQMPALPDPEQQRAAEQAKQEQAISAMISRLYVLNPRQVAEELWAFRNSDDIRSLLVHYCLSVEFDELCDQLLPQILTSPNYQFLKEAVMELRGSRRIWFQDIQNELFKLSDSEVQAQEPESEPYPTVEEYLEQPSVLEP